MRISIGCRHAPGCGAVTALQLRQRFTRRTTMDGFRFHALAALLVALAIGSPAHAEENPLCKNHYILRCTPDDLSLAWTVLPDSHLSHHSGHTATVLADGRVLVIGGAHWVSDPATRSSSIAGPFGAEIFDPVTGSWELTATPSRMRLGHHAVRLLDGRVLVVGGDGPTTTLAGPLAQAHGTAELFDPATGKWSPTDAPLVARLAASATLLPDGRVLFAGGVDRNYDTQPSAEVYDPVTGAWRFTGPLVEPRLSHTATALADGRVLLVGGMTDEFFMTPTGSAEIFDPATGTWTAAGAIEPRWLHTATLTDEGTVVVAGGYISVPGRGGWYTARSFDSSAIFDPSRGAWMKAGNLNFSRQAHLAARLRGHGVVLFGGHVGVTQIPAYSVAPVERPEVLSRGGTRWREALPSGVSATHYHSATELPDGSILFLGTLEGARAMLLRSRD
jgi:hypothetical protein